METLHFHKLVIQAWRATLKKKLPWIFAALVALSSIIENQINLSFSDTPSFEGFWNAFLQKSPQEWIFSFFILLAVFVIYVLGTSNLIPSLSFLTEKNPLPNHPNKLASLARNFLRTFVLECVALLFFVAIIGILAIPFLIASKTNPHVLTTLLDLSLITFLPLAIIVYLIKQFALLYLLLSPLSIRGSIETSSLLFSRSVSLSFLFALFSFLLTVLFTFSVNLVILGSTVLTETLHFSSANTPVIFLISFFSLTWFALFHQALWIAFFKFIARPKETDIPAKEKATVIDNSILPETPPAQ